MDRDEQAIHSLVTTWMAATVAGDFTRVLELMADDVVFLGPGRPAMRGKDGFAAAARAMEGRGRIEGAGEIQEIRVFGDWAYCWNHITIAVDPVGGDLPMRRAGPALSVLRRKPDGAWVIFRDANMVAPAAEPST